MACSSIWARDQSRSLIKVWWNSSYTTFCQSSIVSVALSCTIFELFDVEDCRAIKGSREVIGDDTTRLIAYEILVVFHYNYGHILYRFRDKVRYWSKIAIVFIARLHNKQWGKRFRIFIELTRCFTTKLCTIILKGWRHYYGTFYKILSVYIGKVESEITIFAARCDA